MPNRKEIRDWFYQALSPYSKTLGDVYPVRIVEFEEGKEPPEVFTNIYITQGDIDAFDSGLATQTMMQVEIGFHMRYGKDNDLDQCEEIAEKAIKEYSRVRPPNFNFYKTGFSYAGDTEDAYEQLYLSFQLITQ